jgi:RNA polymerase sigma factor (sigma-70 family)
MPDLPRDRAGWEALARRIERAFASRADAEDALQSAFIRLEEYRAQVAVENPLGFLIRSAMNIGVDQNRRSRVRGEMDDREAALAALVEDAPQQDTVVAARERLQQVMTAIGRLNPRTREVFLMNRVDEMKYAEIASRLGITVSAVEKHMAKAILQVGRIRRGLR